MGRTFDILTRDVLATMASEYTCQYGALVATDISVKDVRTVVKSLMENDARPFNSLEEGSNKFGTAPLAQSFWVLSSVSMLDDLEDLSGWKGIEQYPAPGKIVNHPAEVGSLGMSRWMLSTLGKYDSGTGYYSSFFLAKNSYVTVDLTGNISTEFKDFGSAGTADPLSQLATHGWKAMGYGSLIIQDNWMSEMLSTHTA